MILNDMPYPLRNEIIFYRTHSILDKMPLFQGCQPGFTRSIAMVLNPGTFPPGDYVVVAGEIDQEMYYVDRLHFFFFVEGGCAADMDCCTVVKWKWWNRRQEQSVLDWAKEASLANWHC